MTGLTETSRVAIVQLCRKVELASSCVPLGSAKYLGTGSNISG